MSTLGPVQFVSNIFQMGVPVREAVAENSHLAFIL